MCIKLKFVCEQRSNVFFFQNYINAYGVAFKHLIFIENLSIYRSVSFTYNSFVCLLGTPAPVLVKYVLILTYWFCLNND